MSKSIIVIGGGTGTYVVLSALKKYPDFDLKAVISVTDSGGSTGRLRDQFGTLPVGDLRQCLVALADDTNDLSLLRQLFTYRFDKGDLKGHNFGNIFLTALTEIAGNEEKAIEFTSKILRVKGEVIPVTTEDIDLVAKYSDGSVLVGEAAIDEPNHKHDSTQKIVELKVQPDVKALNKAVKALENADLIVLGPGDLYTSLLAPVVVKGIADAIKKAKGKFVYITNLMTKHGQTHAMTLSDHLSEVIKYSTRVPDYIFVNETALPHEGLLRYSSANAFPVVDDLKDNPSVIRGDLVSLDLQVQKQNDQVTRSLIRHDGDKLAKLLVKILT